MAGHTISLYLKEQGHEVVGFAQEKSKLVDTIVGDARDTLALEKTIKEGRYDSVINCIGILNQFAENNKALASFLNGYFPHFLADVTSGTQTQVIHMSTDCVFSGKKGSYTEDDLPDSWRGCFCLPRKGRPVRFETCFFTDFGGVRTSCNFM